MTKAIVSPKGQIVIPAELRKKYGIKPRGAVEILDKEGIIYLIPVSADPVKALRGILREKTPIFKEKFGAQDIKKELRDEETRWEYKKKDLKGTAEE